MVCLSNFHVQNLLCLCKIFIILLYYIHVYRSSPKLVINKLDYSIYGIDLVISIVSYMVLFCLFKSARVTSIISYLFFLSDISR